MGFARMSAMSGRLASTGMGAVFAMIRALFVLVSLSSVISACQGDPCSELKDQCGDCPGNDQASNDVERICDIVVDADDSDACERALDLDSYECP